MKPTGHIDNNVQYIWTPAVTVIHGLSVRKDYSIPVDYFKGHTERLVVMTSSEDNARDGLLRAGFKEVMNYGNTNTENEIKLLEYVY